MSWSRGRKLQLQKNNRELETIVQECILSAIRDSIPTEAIIRAYMDESVEQEEEVIIENIEDTEPEPEKKEEMEQIDPIKSEEDIPSVVPSIQNIDNEDVVTRLTFNEMESVLDESNTNLSDKSLEQLSNITNSRAIVKRLEEDEEDKIQIHTDTIDLSGFDVLDEPRSKNNEDYELSDVEELP